jgi:hypothetical protein
MTKEKPVGKERKMNETTVWRIWDKAGNRWYRSNYRSVWMSEKGARIAIAIQCRPWFNKEGKDNYEIKKFRLTEEN